MNPLRIDDKPGGDTCYLVRSVLMFMSDAFSALEDGDILSSGSLIGAGQIMSLCADALKPDEEEKGAGDGG